MTVAAPRSLRATILACRLGMFVQALVVNLTPLLFIPLRDQLGLSWEQLGRLVLINFTTQLVVDLVTGLVAGRVGLRVLLVGAHVLAACGLVLFALAPALPGSAYPLLMLGTLVFSSGCGLLEVLLSPVFNALPSSAQARDMALLHAFYPLGKLAVVVGTGLALACAGALQWPWIAVGWAVVPLYGAWVFSRVELPTLPVGGGAVRVRTLAGQPAFIAVLIAMALAGASELAISQWTSAFVQRGLGLSQQVGDLVGFGLFAVGMAAGRLWYGLREGHLDLPRLLMFSGCASAAAYLVAALSPWTMVGFAASCGAGLAVGMLWPATISLAAARWPLAGAMVFALLAAAGDAGAAAAVWLVGVVADQVESRPELAAWLPGSAPAGAGLRAGLLVGALAPLAMIAVAWWLGRRGRAGDPQVAAGATAG